MKKIKKYFKYKYEYNEKSATWRILIKQAPFLFHNWVCMDVTGRMVWILLGYEKKPYDFRIKHEEYLKSYYLNIDTAESAFNTFVKDYAEYVKRSNTEKSIKRSGTITDKELFVHCL